MTEYNLSRFEHWLKSHPKRYAETTVKNTLQEVDLALRRVAAGRNLVPRPATLDAVRRFVRFTEKHGSEVHPSMIAELVSFAETKNTRGQRKKEARSIDDVSWRALCEVIEADPAPEARVLEVQCGTGFRVGDVLRTSRTELASALQTGVLWVTVKGGKTRPIRIEGFEEWPKLFAQWQDDARPEARSAAVVAGWLCPGNPSPLPAGCAYQRVNRKLKALAQALEVPPDVQLGTLHTHRLRRTVGVQALRTTRDVSAVQQLLIHDSINTTMRYLDEARPDDVAEVQRQIRDRFRGEKP